MLTRILGGVAVCVGMAGGALAQSNPPAPLPKAKPAATTPNAPKAPASLAPMPTPAPAPAATMATPAVGPATQMLTEGACASVCNPCCITPCGPPGKTWIDAGYIFWTVSGQNAPALVTTSPAGTPREQAGVLGTPGVRILYPTSALNSDWRSGFYINAGHWFNDQQTCGIELNGFYLGKSGQSATYGGNGTPIVSRPFFNTVTGAQDSELVSFPDVLAGNVRVDSSSTLWGVNPNLIKNCCCGPCGRFDMLLGFYYLSLDDRLTVREDLVSLPGQQNVTPGTRFQVYDSFRTQNDFYGVNIGFAYERRFSHWYAGFRGGVALGVVHQETDIDGYTIITPPGGTGTRFPGGLLAQPSNIGHYERDVFGVLPWANFRLGCQVTTHTRVYVGYDFLYLNSALRAGEQIDPRVNTTQIPPGTPTGPLFPTYTPKSSGVFVHGIRIGAEFRF